MNTNWKIFKPSILLSGACCTLPVRQRDSTGIPLIVSADASSSGTRILRSASARQGDISASAHPHCRRAAYACPAPRSFNSGALAGLYLNKLLVRTELPPDLYRACEKR